MQESTFLAKNPTKAAAGAYATYDHCFDPENATPDSQLFSAKHGKIVNESSLFADEVQDYNMLDGGVSDQDAEEIGLMRNNNILTSEEEEDADCQVNVDDDVMSLSVISKSINTSYINLKRHNPHVVNTADSCPELTNPASRY